MTFIFFTVFLWMLALFHVWDHRRFEDDLRRYAAGVRDLDWRRVEQPGAGQPLLRRAFNIRTRNDFLRYAVPVLFFTLWLLTFGGWLFAALYAALIVIKWFATATVFDFATKRYAVVLCGRRILQGRLS